MTNVSKIKILYIEDEGLVADLYSRSLERAGYEVTVERDGAKGLELAKTNGYDIILLDLMLPSFSGIEILQQLHSQNPPLKSKVVITTNLEQSDSAKDAIDKQADGYLVKADTTPNQLVEFLNYIDTKS